MTSTTDGLWSQEVENAALGAFIGFAVGNATGAMLPLHRRLSEEKVAEALAWRSTTTRRAPGQVSADVEMALCMARALAGHRPRELPLPDLMHWYSTWSTSNPSGVGRTIRRATKIMREAPTYKRDPSAVLAAISRVNSENSCLSNGSLMRAVPLAIWGCCLEPTALADLAHGESSLTHPREECADAVAAYDIALAHLVKNPGDSAGAVEAAVAWAAGNACEEVKGWLEDASKWHEAPAGCVEKIGWVAWPFRLAFMCLSRGVGYEEGLRLTLAAGGEPSTNAAVVGAMLGALHGAGSVPAELWDVVRGCNVGSMGLERAEFMRPSLIPSLTLQLLGCAFELD